MQEIEIPLSEHHIPHSDTSPTQSNTKPLFYTHLGFRFSNSKHKTTYTQHNSAQHNTLTQKQRSQGAHSTRSSPSSFPLFFFLFFFLLSCPQLQKLRKRERLRHNEVKNEGDKVEIHLLAHLIRVKREERELLCMCSKRKEKRVSVREREKERE